MILNCVVCPAPQEPSNRGPAVAVDAVGGDDDGVLPGGEGGLFDVGVELWWSFLCFVFLEGDF